MNRGDGAHDTERVVFQHGRVDFRFLVVDAGTLGIALCDEASLVDFLRRLERRLDFERLSSSNQ